jgi:hypothetical protein
MNAPTLDHRDHSFVMGRQQTHSSGEIRSHGVLSPLFLSAIMSARRLSTGVMEPQFSVPNVKDER